MSETTWAMRVGDDDIVSIFRNGLIVMSSKPPHPYNYIVSDIAIVGQRDNALGQHNFVDRETYLAIVGQRDNAIKERDEARTSFANVAMERDKLRIEVKILQKEVKRMEAYADLARYCHDRYDEI